MINLVDEKGRFVGRLCDYEYLGRRREKKRAGQIGRSKIWCALIVLVLFGLGLWVAMKDSEGTMAVALSLWAWGAILLYLWRRSLRQYRELCAVLKRDCASTTNCSSRTNPTP